MRAGSWPERPHRQVRARRPHDHASATATRPRPLGRRAVHPPERPHPTPLEATQVEGGGLWGNHGFPHTNYTPSRDTDQANLAEDRTDALVRFAANAGRDGTWPQSRTSVAPPESNRRSPRRRLATQDLYERYSAQLLGYCFHKLGSREEAEDAVQQTFLNAFRGLKRGIVPEAEAAWLFKIAENVCLTRRRSSYRRGRVETPGDIQALQEYVAAPQQMGTDELIQLQKALVGMPATQRKAILLREWQGLSYREIADEMGLTQPAVETLIFRARRSLAEGLERPEERTTLLARLRSAFDFASIAGGLKAVLAGSVAAKAVATTAAAVTVAGAVVAAAPEQRSEEAPRAALERAAAARASAPGTTVSALARERADARRDAAATRGEPTPARASLPPATSASGTTDSAAGTSDPAAGTAAAASEVEHPAHPNPVTPASPAQRAALPSTPPAAPGRARAAPRRRIAASRQPTGRHPRRAQGQPRRRRRRRLPTPGRSPPSSLRPRRPPSSRQRPRPTGPSRARPRPRTRIRRRSPRHRPRRRASPSRALRAGRPRISRLPAWRTPRPSPHR